MPVETFSARLLAADLLTDGVRRLRFHRADGEPFTFVAGQFVMVHFSIDGVELQRSYSIGSIPEREDTIDIIVSLVEGGRGSGYLFGLRPGDVATLSGPYGRFVLRKETPPRVFLVATGTGVVPYRSMLPQLEMLAQVEGVHVHVMQGVRTPDDLLFGPEFVQAADRCPDLQFVASYSRAEAPEGEPWSRRGYVQEALLEHAPFRPEDVIYLCGNPAMIDDAVERLRETGMDVRRIRREKYISPK